MRKGKERKDCVYYYYFQETNSIYVGRTVDKKGSHYRHRNNINKDTVAKYAYENGFQVPDMVIIEDGLTVKQGQKQEGFWVDFYKTHCYNVLNKAKTGGIGNLNGGYWNKERCYEEALEYKTKEEFRKGNVSAYNMAYKCGWLKEYTHFIDGYKIMGKNKTIWNYESCYEEAKKYNTRKDFEKGNNSAYYITWKNGWLNVFFSESKTKRRKIKQYSISGDFVAEYNSAHEAERCTGCPNGNIIQCCKGNTRYSVVGGFIWKYAS